MSFDSNCHVACKIPLWCFSFAENYINKWKCCIGNRYKLLASMVAKIPANVFWTLYFHSYDPWEVTIGFTSGMQLRPLWKTVLSVQLKVSFCSLLPLRLRVTWDHREQPVWGIECWLTRLLHHGCGVKRISTHWKGAINAPSLSFKHRFPFEDDDPSVHFHTLSRMHQNWQNPIRDEIFLYVITSVPHFSLSVGITLRSPKQTSYLIRKSL